MATDRDSVTNCVNHVAMTWDAGDFKAARDSFADSVEIDYTSLGAPSATTDSIDTLERNWRAVLPGFDVTQHLLGSHVVEVTGDEATCVSHVIATHSLDGVLWTLGAKYTHRLRRVGVDARFGWKITAMALKKLWSTGDEGLLVKAATKVAAKAAAEGAESGAAPTDDAVGGDGGATGSAAAE